MYRWGSGIPHPELRSGDKESARQDSGNALTVTVEFHLSAFHLWLQASVDYQNIGGTSRDYPLDKSVIPSLVHFEAFLLRKMLDSRIDNHPTQPSPSYGIQAELERNSGNSNNYSSMPMSANKECGASRWSCRFWIPVPAWLRLPDLFNDR